MFEFLKRSGKNKQLEAVLQRLQMNASNNYKDAAQENLKEFERLLEQLKAEGKMGEAQAAYYERELSDWQGRMKKFTHKDQKPTWV